MRRSPVLALFAVWAVVVGCHREVELGELIERTIYTTDRFYDVEALSTDRAVVVGYGGKIIETTNGGRQWAQLESGVDDALFSVYFADDDRGWVTGQDGLILHTADGGRSWTRQESNAVFTDMDGSEHRAYLFSIFGLDGQNIWAVGDRSMLVRTSDGGATWSALQVKMEADLSGGAGGIAAADPVFYDVAFVDPQRGWIVGEFGKIMYTEDGGTTWREQNASLLEGTGFFDPLDLPSLFGVHVRSADMVVASGLEGHVARTLDGGARWAYDEAEVEIPLLDPLFDLVEFEDGSAWAVGAAGEVMRREKAGAPWKRAKVASELSTWLRAIDFSDRQHGWMVGGFGLIFRTTDGGKNWIPSIG